MSEDEQLPHDGGFPAAARLRDLAAKRGVACIGELESVLANGTPPLRCAALEALVELDHARREERAIEVILRNTNNEVRGLAIGLLARSDSPLSFQVLVDCTISSSAFVRFGACDALATRRDPVARWRGALQSGRGDRGLLVRMLARRGDGESLLSLERSPMSVTPMDVSAAAESGGDGVPAFLQSVIERGTSEARLAAIRGSMALTGEAALAPERVLERSFWKDDPSSSVLGDAARRVLRRGALASYDVLAPMLREGDGEDPFWQARAEGILSEVLDVVATASLDPALRREGAACEVDPRWLPLVREVGRRNPGPFVVPRLLRGLRWILQGKRPAHAERVELGEAVQGCGDPFAVLVAGYVTERPLGRRPYWPEHAYAIKVRHGGGRRRSTSFVGYLVEVPELFRAALAELIAKRQNGDLSRALGRDELEAWRAVATATTARPFPAWNEGSEALLVSDDCTPGTALSGFPVLRVRPRVRPWEGPNFYAEQPPEISEVGPFDAHHDAELVRLGRTLRLGAPCIALVWASSQ